MTARYGRRAGTARPGSTNRFSFHLSAALAMLVASTAAAQRVTPGLEVGASRIRFADSVSSSAAAVTPSVLVDWDRASFGAVGTFSQFAGGWSSQGSLQGSLYAQASELLVGELSGLAGGSAHEDGSRTGQTLAIARAHLMGDTRGAWLGVGGGTSWDGSEWHGMRRAELGAWMHLGLATAVATVTPTNAADTIDYTDAELALRWELPRADVGVAGGVRSGDRLPSIGGSASSWGSLSVTGWLSPGLAVVASVGAYPVDLTQGFPGGRFASIGVRFGPRLARRDDRSGAAQRPAATYGAPAAGVLDFAMTTVARDRRTIRVRAPGASRVELNADFTDWRPVALARAADGWWTVTLRIAPGTYQLNVRLDGGAWVVPPGLVPIQDEFGGSVGVLTVP